MSSSDNADPDQHEFDFDNEPKSRSQLKREHLASQAFIQTLLKAPVSRIKQLSLDEQIANDIIKAKQFSKGARNREVKFLAKQLHHVLPELQQQYERMLQPNKDDTRHFHHLENLRDQLLSDDAEQNNQALQHLITEHNCEAQKLRQLVRQAKHEKENNKSPKSSRQLFRYLAQQVQHD